MEQLYAKNQTGYILAISFFRMHFGKYELPNQSVAGTSVSRSLLVLEIPDKGAAYGELIRHLAPLTSSAILKNLPFQNAAHRYADKFIYIESGLIVGADKQRTQFKRGELGFMPSNGSLCIFLKDCVAPPMNPLGSIKSNLDIIESAQPGDTIIVRKNRWGLGDNAKG